jgi:hypothetical protein
MELGKVIRGKTLGAWKLYSENQKIETPIQVLKYIEVLEEELNQGQTLPIPVVVFSEAELKAKLEEQLEETRQWLIGEDFEGLAERL